MYQKKLVPTALIKQGITIFGIFHPITKINIFIIQFFFLTKNEIILNH